MSDEVADPDDALARLDRAGQAMGIVCAQAGCDAWDALDMMVNRASVTGSTFDKVVNAILDGTIRFAE